MPMKIKNLKSINLSCASPASTAICSTTDTRTMVRDATKPGLHHRHVFDHYKKKLSNINHINPHPSNPKLPPCISELPFTPRPKPATPRRKSAADISDLKKNGDKFINDKSNNSSRYLLGESAFSDSPSDPQRHFNNTSNKCQALVPMVRSKERELTRLGSMMVLERENVNINNDKEIKHCEKITEGKLIYGQIIGTDSMSPSVIKSSSSSTRDQVVVLRVSLHCKGCAGKLRKYLSKMEGVKSFNIDLETKKVTVIGNVTPLSILTSISKVKYAQLWPNPGSSSSGSLTSSSSTSTSDFN